MPTTSPPREDTAAIGKLLSKHHKEFGRLRLRDTRRILENPVTAIAAMCDGLEKEHMPKRLMELDFRDSVTLPNPSEKFKAKGAFKKGAMSIVSIDKNFLRWFSAKVEDPVGFEMSIRCFNLPFCTTDIELSYLLGGENRCPVYLYHFHALLEMHMKTGTSLLLMDSRWNMFYIYDTNHELRHVSINWSNGGWNIQARSFASHYGGHAQGVVFSS